MNISKGMSVYSLILQKVLEIIELYYIIKVNREFKRRFIMKHIVLFKFEDRDCLDKVDRLLEETYEKLENTHKVIEGYKFSINCLEDKENNMDIILFVDLASSEALPAYINHPDHQEVLAKLKSLGLKDKSVIDIH